MRLTQRPLADGPGVEFLRLERVVGRLRWYDGAGGGDAGWWLEREAGDAEALWQCPASTPDLDGARVAHEAAARWFADWILTHPAGRGHESPRD